VNQVQVLPLMLLAVLGLPLLAAIAVSQAGRRGRDAARCTAAYFAAAHLILTAILVILGANVIEPSNRGTSFETFQPFAVPGDPGASSNTNTGTTTWMLLPLSSANDTAIQFFLGLDGLNLPLVGLASLMVFLGVLVSWESVGDRAGGFYAWLFLLQAATIGAFLSFDLLLFYIFFELTLIPAFFLIGSWGVGSGRRDAARKFFLYTLFGSLFTLVGILGIAITNPTPLREDGKRVRASSIEAKMPATGAVTFSIPELMENVHVWDEAHAAAVKRARALFEKSPGNADAAKAVDAALAAQQSRRSLATWLFLALLAGFAVKLPIVPFHTWLPSAYSEAAIPVTMFLAAVLGKLGAFGILRIVLPLTPEPAVTHGLTAFGTLGAIGIVYAALCAFAQKDLKLLAAYSSVSHLGFLTLGLFALTPESLTGATLHMVNHGLTAGATFALLAFLADRYRTLDIGHYGGLWARYPRYTFFFIVIALASVGLPGLNNFVSEMLMLAGLFDPRNLALAGMGLAASAAGGIFLSAWYTFTVIRRVFFGPLKEPAGVKAKDLTGRECATFSLLAALCLALGLCPQPVIDTVSADANRVAKAAEAARSRLNVKQASPAESRREEDRAENKKTP
jgi:NADH-quinone oxidoreductase subunit M